MTLIKDFLRSCKAPKVIGGVFSGVDRVNVTENLGVTALHSLSDTQIPTESILMNNL